MKPSTSPYFRSNGTGARSGSSSQSSTSKKAPVKQNKSILNFFQKAEGPPKLTNTQHRITQYVTRTDKTAFENRVQIAKQKGRGSQETTDSLFFDEEEVGDGQSLGEIGIAVPSGDLEDEDLEDIGYERIAGVAEDERYNENEAVFKRRKLHCGPESADTVFGLHRIGDGSEASVSPGKTRASSGKGNKHRHGPFVDESDSEDDGFGLFQSEPGVSAENKDLPIDATKVKCSEAGDDEDEKILWGTEETGGLNGIVPDVENKDIWDGDSNTPYENGECETPTKLPQDEPAVCPICRAGLDGLTDMEASAHANHCLDGNTTLCEPNETRPESTKSLTKEERKLLARPAQRDPFIRDPKSSSSTTTSAFSKLMTANAEDSAWAAAATNEIASKGKQSYERTCPFYKILPGFSICVDAFRYGAVEGCSAYFLSHFHSDHYIGLNASWRHGMIYCSRVTGNLVRQQLKVDPKWIVDIEWEEKFEIPGTGGVHVTMTPANHCPGSSLFMFEKATGKKVQRFLHCGDFRASPTQVQHPLLRPQTLDETTGKLKDQSIDVCYLDTTYLNPKYGFPSQDTVITACAEKCVMLNGGRLLGESESTKSKSGQNMTKYLAKNTNDSRERPSYNVKGRLLVVIGTYSIGKERICLGIARALNSKICVPPAKQKICACLEDEELSSFLTTDPLEAQVHMQSLMEIRAETLLDYMNKYGSHFSRVVGFRPTGWNYRPPAGRITDNPTVNSVLYSDSWKTRFSLDDLVPARGSNKESMCFSVPYSEHSSFRDLTAFCCALRIGRIIPTVNVGSSKAREKMKFWIERWDAEKKKSGLFKVEEGATQW